MEIVQYLLDYWLVIFSVLLIGGLFILVIWMNGLIVKTFGYGFLKSLITARHNSQKGFIVLEIKHRSGARQFVATKQSPLINYTIKENKKEKNKIVIYDPRAVDHIMNIPILSCSPNEIRPIDRDTGLLVNIPGEMLDKLAKDATLDYQANNDYQKLLRMVLWGAGIVMVGVLLMVSYMWGNIVDLNSQLIAAERLAAQSATIIGN